MQRVFLLQDRLQIVVVVGEGRVLHELEAALQLVVIADQLRNLEAADLHALVIEHELFLGCFFRLGQLSLLILGHSDLGKEHRDDFLRSLGKGFEWQLLRPRVARLGERGAQPVELGADVRIQVGLLTLVAQLDRRYVSLGLREEDEWREVSLQ